MMKMCSISVWTLDSLKITNDVFEPVNMHIELRQPINNELDLDQ